MIRGDTTEKSTEYKKVGITWKRIKETFPKEMTDIQYVDKIFGVLFVLSIFISIFNFSFSSLFPSNSGSSASIKIGYPFAFLILNLADASKNPMSFSGFAYDVIIYIALAYLMNVFWNVLRIQIENYRKKHPPKLYKVEK